MGHPPLSLGVKIHAGSLRAASVDLISQLTQDLQLTGPISFGFFVHIFNPEHGCVYLYKDKTRFVAPRAARDPFRKRSVGPVENVTGVQR